MSLNAIKNAGIGGLLLLLLATAFFGFRSIGHLVHTLTDSVELHNPSQTALVKLTERLGRSSEQFNAFSHRDRTDATDVEDAMKDVAQRFLTLAGEAEALGTDALPVPDPSNNALRWFVLFVEEVESSDAYSDGASEKLERIWQSLRAARDALANFSTEIDRSGHSHALALRIEACSSALSVAEQVLERFLVRDTISFEQVVQPLTESLSLLDGLDKREQRHVDAHGTAELGSTAAADALHRLRDAITHARSTLWRFQQEDDYDPNSVATREAEKAVRERWADVTLALFEVNDVVGRRIEKAQRESIVAGARWQREFIWLSAAALVLAIAISVFMGRYIRGRLQPISNGTRRFASGELSHRIPEDSRDALGALGAVFNQMAAQLERKEQELIARIADLDQANRDARLSNAYLDRLIDSIPDPLLVVDASRRVVRSNPAACALADYVADEMDGLAITSLLTVDPTAAVEPDCEGRDCAIEAELTTKDGEHVPVSLSTAELGPDEQHAGGTIIVAQDRRHAKWAERRRSMKYRVARLLSDADSLASVMPKILATLGGALDYACASYWQWDENSRLLRHAQTWSVSSAGFSEFLACQSTNDPRSPGGLIRRTWDSGKFEWIADVGSEASFRRAPFASAAGLRGAFATPVRDGSSTYGVFELFSTDNRAPDPELMEDIQSIGAQIAQFCRRKEAECALQEKTRHLEQSNRELDQFAYVTSHDLKAPLRAIANLASWIEEDLGEKLTDDVKENMQLLRGRVHRMEGLIQGILDYSRIGRENVRTERVDVSALVAEVIDSLPVPPEFQINLPERMPVLTAPKVRLFQVFSNLIGNAIKYHDRMDGCVEMAVSNGGQWYEFVVEDDGPGIPKEYHDKVFGIFQTLEARDKIESTGIGLTLVKKIIEDQGGHITIAEHEGRGARFQFTWPAEAEVK